MWSEELGLDVTEGEIMLVELADVVEEVEGEDALAAGIPVSSEGDFDLEDVTELFGDRCDEVAEGLTSVVTPSITKTPFLFSQQLSARVPFPQQ